MFPSFRKPAGLLMAGVLLLAAATAARAQQYRASFSADEYSLAPGANYVMQRHHIDGIDLLTNAATANPPLKASDLILVYDTTTDAFEILKRSDSSIVSTIFTLGGGLPEFTGIYGIDSARQAFLFLPGATATPVGSIGGLIHRVKDAQGNVLELHWTADFNVGETTGGPNTTTPSEVLVGSFHVGVLWNTGSMD